MKTEIKIPVRAYSVTLRDTRTDERITDTIVLEKSRIQAAALFDLGDEDIIYRIYNRRGYRVLEIGKSKKVELTVDLGQLYASQTIIEQMMASDIAHSELVQEGKEKTVV